MTFLSTVAVISAVFLATPSLAREFSAEDLHTALKSATDTFKVDYSDALHTTIYAFQITKRNDGGRAKIFYVKDGQNVATEYFCHYHGANTIDCHEL